MSAASEDPEIGPVPPEQHADAFALVCDRLAADERPAQVEALVKAVMSGEIAPQGLLGAYRGGRLVGAVFSQVQPGKTAMVWPPRIIADEPAMTAGKLLDATSDFLYAGGVCIAQVQSQLDCPRDDVFLRQHGYARLTDLLYLVSLEGEFPTEPPQSQLEFEPYSVANHNRLAQIVEATYQQTCDCPQLDGVREIEDILASYRATGRFEANRWLIVRHHREDVGCLLLADHPDRENYELVYMGVVAAYRGHGWGMEIARHAQWLTRQAGRPRLVLAVDAANDPAIQMYAAVGFRAWERRSVYLKVFGRAD